MEWTDPDASMSFPLWPAYRVIGMQAPDGGSAVRMTAIGVLWRSALDDLADGLLQRLSIRRAVTLAHVLPRRAAH